jgi:hypothetical protein
LQIRDWESNARKGGFEGSLARDIQAFKDQWKTALGREPTPQEIRAVFGNEMRWIQTDVHARPVDPNKFNNLPAPND